MTGLPNWRSKSWPLQTYFEPGERFSYSGEGFAGLQAAVERKAGEPLDAIASRLVFQPLRMFNSGYVWRESFEANHAASHDDTLKPMEKFKPICANAAFSLHTTPEDYGRFLEAVMSGEGLGPATARLWLEPAAHPPIDGFLSLDESDPLPLTSHGDSAGGLSLGAMPSSIGEPMTRLGRTPLGGRRMDAPFVAFMNSENGFAIVPKIARIAVPGYHPSLRWLSLGE